MPAEKPICPLCEAREKLEKATRLAGELIATIRVNAIREAFATATVEQIEEFIAPRIEQLKAIEGEHHFRRATEMICETNTQEVAGEALPPSDGSAPRISD